MMKKIGLFSSGIVYGLSFPLFLTLPTGILAWFSLVPLLLSVRGVSTFKAYFSLTFPVICVGTFIVGAFVSSFSGLAFLVTCTSQTILSFLPLVVHYFIQQKIGWRRSMWLLPTVWTVCDWCQHLVPHSFQVTSLAYTQTTVLWFAQMADIFGMWGITCWVVAVNVSLALTIDAMGEHYPRVKNFWIAALQKWAFQGLLLFGLPLLYAFVSNAQLLKECSIKVALVQTNEESNFAIDSVQFDKNLRSLIRLADSAAQSKPDLMVLPESALHLPLMGNAQTFDAFRAYVSNWQTAVAVGFPDYPDTLNRNMFYNAAFVFTPALAYKWDSLRIKTTDLKVYRKQNPLPVAEMMPYGDVLGIKGKVLPCSGEVLQGNEAYVFSFPDRYDHEVKTSVTICWEQFFPETQAELTKQGAAFLTQMNNDGWFGNSSGAVQLLNMNRLRAIENRRTIARCSNTGISGFIDPFGRLYGQMPPKTTSIHTDTVYLNSNLSIFSRYGNWFPKACLTTVILCLIILRKRKGV